MDGSALSPFAGVAQPYAHSITFGNVLRMTTCPPLSERVDHRERVEAILYSRMVTASLSFLGALSIVVFSIKAKKLRRAEVHPIFNLSLADMLLSAAWLTGSTMFYIGHQEPCDLVAYFVWSLELTTHLLTVVYAVVAVIRLKEKCSERAQTSQGQPRKTLKKWRVRLNRLGYIVAWILPFLLGLPRILLDTGTHRCARCLLLWGAFESTELNTTLNTPASKPHNVNGRQSRDDGKEDQLEAYSNTVFLVVLVLSMLALIILYIKAWRLCTKVLRRGGFVGSRSHRKMRNLRMRTLFYLLIFFYCWFVASIVAVWVRVAGKAIGIGSVHGFVFLLVQAITTPMQGFLNSMVYGWTRKSFRENTAPHNYGATQTRQQGEETRLQNDVD